MKALGISERRGCERFVSQQIHYSLQARDAEYELVPAGLDQGVGILVWSPLAGGLLSASTAAGQDRRRAPRQLTDWNEPPVHDEGGLYDIVDALVEIAEARGVVGGAGRAGVAARPPGRDRVVVGARTDEQLADNLARGRPDAGRRRAARLDELSAPALLYPYWHQAKTARDRLGAADLTLLGAHVGAARWPSSHVGRLAGGAGAARPHGRERRHPPAHRLPP